MAFFWTSAVVAGIRTEPTIELAKAISLTTENGVIVQRVAMRNRRSPEPRLIPIAPGRGVISTLSFRNRANTRSSITAGETWPSEPWAS